MKIVYREPWRGGQICGYQESYGMPGSTFCGELKAPGLYHCQEHHDWLLLDGPIRMAEGNAVGLELTFCSQSWLVRDADGELISASGSREVLASIYGFDLKWEGAKGEPEDPADEELRAFEETTP